MQILETLDELTEACAGGVCMTIGVFDGVHRGHRHLIARATQEARAAGLPALAFTFRHHPLSVLAPAYAPPSLIQPEQKAQLFESLGVDLCLLLQFNRDFASTAPETFVREILGDRCQARFVICGPNFTFGAGGSGDTAMLRKLGEELGIRVEIAAPVQEGTSMISSTRIRDSLLQGKIAEANAMLTRPYGFEARVVEGHKRGRTIGFPTANLQMPTLQLVPADGVYAVGVRLPDGTRAGGMLNIGTRPTFEAGRSVEVFIFDFNGELVGETLGIEFIRRTRDEQKFNGIEALVAQLKQDEVECRTILAGIS